MHNPYSERHIMISKSFCNIVSRPDALAAFHVKVAYTVSFIQALDWHCHSSKMTISPLTHHRSPPNSSLGILIFQRF